MPEGLIVRSQFHRYEGTAARRCRIVGLQSELRERAADLPRFVFVAVLQLGECQRLAVLQPIEGGFNASERGANARLPAAVAALQSGEGFGARFRARSDRAGGVSAAAQRRCAGLEQGLTPDQIVELL